MQNSDKWLKWTFFCLISLLLAACGQQRSGNNNANVNDNVSDSNSQIIAQKGSGLASASKRKAIIDELGKNFQESQSGKYRKQVSSIAPFKIELVNGKTYTYKDLPKNKEVTLVYFSPTCQECEQFTESLLQRINTLTDREIIYITYEDTAAVRSFYKRFKLEKYPQIVIGTEGYSFIVQKYYKVQHFPFVASYDRSGQLIHILTNNTQPRMMAKNI
ncbi:hypothetical protein SAMN05192529_12040 [Arachidicoccus rhizosphaerae]|jgi:hypothetical protein|uniref:AhpC/TSA family protein n=1 Tax=Arachidicoccus rhizosphaerae TaxID=551991 RepID=A0A1H4BE54_9BACT|nr:hypothetical protein [Arachidicoccus rhizosphaerae]SEA46443.1 hypothetical protein SAMN05192529_12040 [Arachidicoccus rhizosphaerae]